MKSSLVTAIECQIEAGTQGGIEQYLIGLLDGLDKIAVGDEKYLVVGAEGGPDWFYSTKSESIRSVIKPRPAVGRGEKIKRSLGPLRRPLGIMTRRLLRRNGPLAGDLVTIPQSDGFWEELGADLLHITYPLNFVVSKVPTIFTLHDLQHRHFPQFFPGGHLHWRETVYPVAFQYSRVIITVSRWVKDDLIRQYGVPSEKIFVVPLASPAEAYPPIDRSDAHQVSAKLRLPDSYMLYPSVTYEHKNHVRLLEALALLRDRDGLKLNLVCTGSQRLYWPQVRQRMKDLNLTDQVRFLGFLKVPELRAVFAKAQYLVFPSLFEGAGIPLLDALFEGLPATCSDIPAFREYADDAALFFDPFSIECIAAALKRMSTDADFRQNLRKLGYVRSECFTWAKSAEAYRAVYRKTAGKTLSFRDQDLLRFALSGPGESAKKLHA